MLTKPVEAMLEIPGAMTVALSFEVDSYNEDSPALLGIPLAERWRGAVAKRKAEYLAGRKCAAMALTALGSKVTAVGMSGQAPEWPKGYVGSITHNQSYAAATVAKASVWRTLGIDVEEIDKGPSLAAVRAQALNSSDVQAIERYGLDRTLGAFLCFSAKESLYKALWPLHRTFFSFEQAAITAWQLDAGQFTYQLIRDVAPGFACGYSGQGWFAVRGPQVATAIVLP